MINLVFVLLFFDSQGGEWESFSLDELQNLRVRDCLGIVLLDEEDNT